jgi:hypothetical protein
VRRFLLLPAYFGVLLLALFGSPAIANHDDPNSDNLVHVANRTNSGGTETNRTYTDLAVWGKTLAQGTYDGFRLFDISNPASPKLLVDFRCFGGQGDVSLYKAGNRLLLFRSIDTPQQGDNAEPNPYGPNPDGYTCDTKGNQGAFNDNSHFEGIRVLDITNRTQPKLIKSVYTDCGSHTHTLVRDTKNNRAIIYVSSYPLSPVAVGPNCAPPHAKIGVIVVPDSNPARARLHHYQEIHSIEQTDEPEPGHGDAPLEGVTGCHDITVFTDPKVMQAAAACLTEAQLWDISNPLYPCTQEAATPAAPKNQGPDCHTHIDNPLVELFHSSAYTWDARVVTFEDEHGGALTPGCTGPQDTTGNIWFYKNVDPGTQTVPLLGRYAIPRAQPAEWCTNHNYNIIPIDNNRRYIGVGAAYQAGTTVFDFTEVKSLLDNPPDQSADPETVADEIAWWDDQNLDGNGKDDVWSTYWHNNFIWASGGIGPARAEADPRFPGRGLDVFKLLVNGRRFTADTEPIMNPQTQEDLEENEAGEN